MSLLNEAAQKRTHPLRSEIGSVCTALCGKYNYKVIPSESLRLTRKKAGDLINSTFNKRKDFYSRSSKTSTQFKGCVSTYSGMEYELVKIRFRYVEEFMMVLGLMYNTIRKGTYPILKSELVGVTSSLSTVKLTPKMRAFFSKGIENFDQKCLTKFAYEMYTSHKKDINQFVIDVYVALEHSRVIANLFALSYEHLMIEKRDDIVFNTCYKTKNIYKFTFDSFYWSKEAFEKVIKTKTPSPRR